MSDYCLNNEEKKRLFFEAQEKLKAKTPKYSDTHFSSLKEVLMLIDEKFNYEEVDNPDELDSVSASIAERDYYQNSNK